MYDVLIAGGGPAGMTAAIYAVQSGLSTLLIAGPAPGGQVATSNLVENYPGFPLIYGADLVQKLTEHVSSAGVKTAGETVQGVQLNGAVKTVRTESGSYEGRTVILAQGSERRKLGVPGEDRLRGRGVSYCATCDGNFFRKKTVAVIGGGNTAAGSAAELAGVCKKVYLVTRRPALRAEAYLVKQLRGLPNVEHVAGWQVGAVEGAQKVESLLLKNSADGTEKRLPVDGVFVSVGVRPNTRLLEGVLPLAGGFVKAGEDCVTDIPGVYAAGDIRGKQLYQIVTAISDGANAAHSALLYLQAHRPGA